MQEKQGVTGCIASLQSALSGSRPDPDMALRVATYALDLCRELRTRKVVKAGGPHPALLPLVLHNGDRPWRAPTELSALVALPGQGTSANGGAPHVDAGRLGPDLAPFQLGQRHFVCGGSLTFRTFSARQPSRAS